MSSLDFEEIATVRVLRDRFSGVYLLQCDFDVHTECTVPTETVEDAFDQAKDVVRAELRARTTLVPPVPGREGENDG